MNDLNPTDSTPQDERRPIPGYDGQYEIDTAGNVYAMIAFRQHAAGRLMKSRANPDGYITVTLHYEGQAKIRTIHRLLMLTFRPIENSDKMEVNHIDGVKHNNDLSNLEWLTRRQNMHYSHFVLKSWHKMVRTEKTYTHKLTEDQVRSIRKLLAEGKMLQKDIGRLFGVSQVTVSQILCRKIWGHLD